MDPNLSSLASLVEIGLTNRGSEVSTVQVPALKAVSHGALPDVACALLPERLISEHDLCLSANVRVRLCKGVTKLRHE